MLAACAAWGRQPAHPREPVELAVLTPDAGWGFRVREVRETPTEVWIWAELQRRPGPAAQMLSTVRAEVLLPADKPQRVFVSGKTWSWPSDEPYTFIAGAPEWPADAQPVEISGDNSGPSSAESNAN